ncbi:hypothetical protein AAIG96_34895, partial [Pseudomonas aeruginosa]
PYQHWHQSACEYRWQHLASRSANAANDIRKLIDASADKVQSGSQQVHAAGRTMEDIVAQVKNVTQLIREQRAPRGSTVTCISCFARYAAISAPTSASSSTNTIVFITFTVDIKTSQYT